MSSMAIGSRSGEVQRILLLVAFCLSAVLLVWYMPGDVWRAVLD